MGIAVDGNGDGNARERRGAVRHGPDRGAALVGTLVAVTGRAGGDPYLSAEDRARVEIDQKLAVSGWLVQPYRAINLAAGRGVAVREFVLKSPHGRADYLLFVDRKPVGAIEAKPEGTTLTEVELQTAKYGDGLPDGVVPPVMPLPFRYESTGKVTRFTNTRRFAGGSSRIATSTRCSGFRPESSMRVA